MFLTTRAHAYEVTYTMQKALLTRDLLHAVEDGPTYMPALFYPSSLVFVFHSALPNSHSLDFCRIRTYKAVKNCSGKLPLDFKDRRFSL